MEYTYHVTIHLNARFQPMHRFDLEDALQGILDRMELGAVDGGGTLQMSTGEIRSCDIEVFLKDNEQETIHKLRDIINRLGVPKGSELQFEDDKIAIGGQEGLAVYLNGTDLPEETYKNCDINYVIEKMEELLQGIGRMYSYWEGANETALYFYGNTYSEMLERTRTFLADYPLCQRCRVERIA